MSGRLVPYACAVLNAAAAIALAALSPGTLAEPDPHARADFIDRHLLAWRACWSIWIGASSSLMLLLIWWERRTREAAALGDRRHRGRAVAPLAIAAIGLGCDFVGESLQIVAVPDAPGLMPVAVLLTAGVANGLYTAAGALLTLRTRLDGVRAAWTWAVWVAGTGVSVTAFASSVGGLVVTSAVLFALFCPWCIALERWLRR